MCVLINIHTTHVQKKELEEEVEKWKKGENRTDSIAQRMKVLAAHTWQLEFNAQSLCNGFHCCSLASTHAPWQVDAPIPPSFTNGK